MKVFLTSPVWTLNGVNVFCANLTRGLRARGWDARILLTDKYRRDQKPLPLPRDIPIESLPVSRFSNPEGRRRALRAVLEHNGPCIYFPNHDFHHSQIVAQLSSRVSVIGVIHSDDAQHYAHATEFGRYWHQVVAVSRAIEKRILELDATLAGRVETIPYGVHIPDEIPERRGHSALRILYTGRLEEKQKRVSDLLAIAGLLQHKHVPFEMYLVGNGPHKKMLQREIRARGLTHAVRIVETVANDQVAQFAAQADVFLLTSGFEGLPISLLEAMASGCVPVVSDLPSGIPELIADGEIGYRVPIGDVETFAARLESLYRQAEFRRQMSRAARGTILQNGYRVQDMAARYDALFKHALCRASA